MPDIAMCVNEKCKKRNQCYRYKAEPSLYQTYCEFNDCKEPDYEDFWEMKVNKRKEEKN